MELVAYGAQDIYLTGNPQITFWKVVYRRHTNFAIESVSQTFNGTADFGKTPNAVISRNGDLIHRVYLQVDLPALANSAGTVNWVRNLGHVMIDYVELQIGGQLVDKQYGDWMNIWNELCLPAEKEDGYNVMIGNTVDLTTPSASIAASTIYVPLQFWFCRNAGLALPLIALQYHEVKISLKLRPAAQCIQTDDGALPSSGTPSLVNAQLYVDYIYLDTDERRRFAQVAHEYLIEQVQFTGDESISSTSNKIKLNFNHPCKFFAWVIQLDSNVTNGNAVGPNNWADYTDQTGGAFAGGHTLTDAKIQLNGHDRFSVRAAAYFNQVQPYQHFNRCPATGIYVWSAALTPLEHQPSGSVNMSRIDNATLVMNVTTGSNAAKLRVYAFSCNVLRIMSGMGGLAYSN
jgi:hypothetical protein